MGVGHEQTHARHRRLIYTVDCKTPLSCLLMVNGVNFPLFDPSANNQQPGRRNIWGSVSTGRSSDFGRGGRVAHVFKRFSALHLLFACFGLLAWETVTGRQLQCEKNLSSNRPTFVKNRATIDIKTKATSY